MNLYIKQLVQKLILLPIKGVKLPKLKSTLNIGTKSLLENMYLIRIHYRLLIEFRNQ